MSETNLQGRNRIDIESALSTPELEKSQYVVEFAKEYHLGEPVVQLECWGRSVLMYAASRAGVIAVYYPEGEDVAFFGSVEDCYDAVVRFARRYSEVHVLKNEFDTKRA